MEGDKSLKNFFEKIALSASFAIMHFSQRTENF